MTFRGTQAIIVWTVINMVAIIISFTFFNLFVGTAFSILLFCSLVYGYSSEIQIIGSNIRIRTLFKRREIDISEIKFIEAVTEKMAGYIYIRLGKTNTEDYYILHLKNKEKVKVNAYLKNKGISLGRHLKNAHKVQFKKSDKIKYVYGNP